MSADPIRDRLGEIARPRNDHVRTGLLDNALRAVLDLHVEDGKGWCADGCDTWAQCPTRLVIAAALGVKL